MRAAYEELSATKDQLAQAHKLEAVGRLAGGIAHDFNNLLTVITGRADFLLHTFQADDPRLRQIDLISQTARRAAALTRQLLAFSRKQVLQPKVLDLNAVVGTMDAMLRRLIGEDIDLLTALQPDLGRVKADPGQLEQVILNLAVNARDAMPRGGRLTLETADVELDETHARRHIGARPGRYVKLAVSDTGCGMDAETQARIFEPFFTTKEAGKGTGLGLATVYGIVKQSGGHIWVYSEPGRGTIFKIYLPRVEEVPESAAPEAYHGIRRQGSETVLLAEDDAELRGLASEILRGHGYTVLEATNGVEGAGVAEGHAGPIHALVTDVVMPRMGGRELAEALRSAHPETKVVYMSGYTDNAIMHHGVLEPGIVLLEKPFTPDALLGKVREVLDAPESCLV
jgi:nitrogen-specific signal transduction histidine kinase/CheY-like chemotaxis protein